MTWNAGAVGPDKATVRASFALHVARDPYSPKDGRLEAAVDVLLNKMPDPSKGRKYHITTSGHINADGTGQASVSVLLEK